MKPRLFVCACCRAVWRALEQVEANRNAVEVGERMADGSVSVVVLEAARTASWVAMRGQPGADNAAMIRAARAAGGCLYNPSRVIVEVVDNAAAAGAWHSNINWDDAFRLEQAAQSALLRDLFGPLPFRPLSVDTSVLRWNSGVVARLAEAAYRERELPSGHLEQGRLSVLADALEEAGAGGSELVEHLRSEGPHVRGCFAVDSLTGRG